MQDCENHNPVRFDPIEDRVGKAGDEQPSDIRVERSKHPGKLFDGIERGIDLDEKLLAQAANLLFIPLISGGQVSSYAAAKDDRQ